MAVPEFDLSSIDTQVIDTPIGGVAAKFLKIDDTNLHGELDRNPEDFAFFAGWEATAAAELKQKEQELEQAESRAWQRIIDQAPRKPSVEDLKRAIVLDDEVMRLRKDVALLEHGLNQLKNVRMALWRKGDLLQTKVHLRRSQMSLEQASSMAQGIHRDTEKRMREDDDSN